MDTVMGIDIGLRHTGYAIRLPDGGLKAGVINRKKKELIANIKDQTSRLSKSFKGESPVTAIEIPVVYGGHRGKGDPNILLRMSLLAGSFSTLYSEVYFFTPQDWKGNLPKEVFNRRLFKHEPQAFDAVAHIKETQQEHALDAIGILRHLEEVLKCKKQ